jgi:hypothetical protein
MVYFLANADVRSAIVYGLGYREFASGLGLNKTGDDLYQTADYDSSANKIDLSIDAGVSSIKIIQY